MPGKPLLTVLMPVYNAEKFLTEAIESVLNQTFEKFEFLIIDDGSTDNSINIIKSYADPRIRLCQNEKNSGISATLNRGIELAKTEWIARMDADDICYPTRLEKQYDFIMAHPDGALFSCWAEEITEEKEFIRVERFNPDDYFYNLTFSFWMYHPTFVFKRDAVKSIGMYTVPYAEDYELVWQLSRKFKLYPQPEVLLKYRISPHSLWQVTRKQEYKDAMLQQIRRNICYYNEEAGRQMDQWQIEQLGTDAAPGEFSVQAALNCIKLLDLITKEMLQKENVNLVPEHIKLAAKRKRDYLFSRFAVNLGYWRGSNLLIRAKAYNVLMNLIIEKFKKAI